MFCFQYCHRQQSVTGWRDNASRYVLSQRMSFHSNDLLLCTPCVIFLTTQYYLALLGNTDIPLSGTTVARGIGSCIGTIIGLFIYKTAMWLDVFWFSHTGPETERWKPSTSTCASASTCTLIFLFAKNKFLLFLHHQWVVNLRDLVTTKMWILDFCCVMKVSVMTRIS